MTLGIAFRRGSVPEIVGSNREGESTDAGRRGGAALAGTAGQCHKETSALRHLGTREMIWHQAAGGRLAYLFS